MKDNFSANSSLYAQFRPGYSLEIVDFILKKTKEKEVAWDCGTGNGQVAIKLADHFTRVEATDISLQQIQNALQSPAIHYTLQPAEKTNFPNDRFDLLTVGQAVHWFNFESFYKEAKRTLKPGGIIAILGYGLFRSNRETNRIIDHFYSEVIGPYWDPERKYLDENYNTIPFPFREIEAPVFTSQNLWSFERLEGYLRTWSAVSHFQKKNGYDPVKEISKDLKEVFGDVGEVNFPILLRLGENTK